MRYTSSTGTVWLISKSCRLAYPLRDPDRRPRNGYIPSRDWDMDCAAACGLLVDARIDASDYRVRGAGPEWREVYQHLQELLAAKPKTV